MANGCLAAKRRLTSDIRAPNFRCTPIHQAEAKQEQQLPKTLAILAFGLTFFSRHRIGLSGMWCRCVCVCVLASFRVHVHICLCAFLSRANWNSIECSSCPCPKLKRRNEQLFCMYVRVYECPGTTTVAATNKIHINYIHFVLSLVLLSAITLRYVTSNGFCYLFSFRFQFSALVLHLN